MGGRHRVFEVDGASTGCHLSVFQRGAFVQFLTLNSVARAVPAAFISPRLYVVGFFSFLRPVGWGLTPRERPLKWEAHSVWRYYSSLGFRY